MGKPFRKRAFSCVRVAPPVRRPETSQRVRRVEFEGSSGVSSSARKRSLRREARTSEICLANSRVGAMMMARVPIDRSI